MDNQWLQPLNEYIGVAGKKFAAFFNKGRQKKKHIIF